MSNQTTIAIHDSDKEQIDNYIRERFNTNPANIPYRIAVLRAIKEATNTEE